MMILRERWEVMERKDMGQGDYRDGLQANEIFSVRNEFLTDKQRAL